MTHPTQPATPIARLRQRRRTLLAQIGDGIAILPTAPEAVRNRDTHYPYRPDSYFWYLTAFPEPEAIVVLLGGKRPKSLLFCRQKHAERETWDGFRFGPKAAKAAFGFDAAYPIEDFAQRLPALLADRPALWSIFGQDAAWDARLHTAVNAVRAQSRAGKQAPTQFCDLRSPLDALRLIKDTDELAHMRRAAEITSAGHRAAMRASRPGLFEYQLEAEISYAFRHAGADAHAYPPIVAGGMNACTLHYICNNQPLADGDLVLIDAGCECAGYAADITRTFPVNGRFSGPQRAVYDIVLAAQAAAFAATRPGAGFMAPHEAALRVLTTGLVDLGLLQGDIDGLLEQEAYKPWYMHRTGHWLGLDVHDAGEYKTGKDWTPLQPGMTLTIEPGLYLRPTPACPALPPGLSGIGIRIEDDALVTTEGCECLTDAPRSIADIEECMRHD